MNIKKTSLYEEHLFLNAKMTEYSGYMMPLQYSSINEEVKAVRQNTGMFDVGHMGEFLVEGPHAVIFVDFLITNDLKNSKIKKAVYTPLCREDGTIIDDLIVYKLSDSVVLICVNASNIKKDWDWITSRITSFNCTIKDLSDSYSLIALQGPNAESVLKKTGLIIPDDFSYYSIIGNDNEKEKLLIARTGYTGEDGFEIFSNHSLAKILWKKFIDLGVTPCGLIARDVLRIEVCYPLYGHELTDNLTPLDTNIAWTVKNDKHVFIGSNTLKNFKRKYRIIYLSIEKGIPREGYKVVDQHKRVVGKITSGTMSITTGQGVSMALIKARKFPRIKKFYINIRDNYYEAILHTKPFVIGGHK